MAASRIEFGVYLPQVGTSWEDLRDRVLLCEDLGFHSVWFMDHLYPPELPQVPSFEAWTIATAVLALTSRIRVGHLVLSNTFRHPALLAKMATTLDVVSSGRLELGLGSGSYAPEHERAGIRYDSPRDRARELEEALAIVRAAFAGEPVTHEGRFYRVRDLPNLPPPAQAGGPPIHVGGAGERWTLPLVARYADVWNCPTYALADFDRKRAALARCCAAIGRDPASIRTSQEAVAVLVEKRADVDDARALALRRFGGPGWGVEAGGYVGTPDDLVARIRESAARGVSLFVFFFHDRASPETLRRFARDVAPEFASATA
ncbi:MAG TPA: LLM class flavin-dependent oxidoreductase [Candidatus Binatia bacterium]|nr:LLM class flavin-dependent oxidoreductase [Candidatus Binatia bacterium]